MGLVSQNCMPAQAQSASKLRGTCPAEESSTLPDEDPPTKVAYWRLDIMLPSSSYHLNAADPHVTPGLEG